MKAFILAAGLGTRLAPLTQERAKPALPLAGRPMLARVLEQVSMAGIQTIRVNSHHRPESIDSVIEAYAPSGTDISTQHESVLLGTGGALVESRDWIGDDPVLVVNGDAVSDVDLGALIDAHRSADAVATMTLRTPSDGEQFGRVEVNQDGRVVRILEDGPPIDDTTSKMFCGIHIVEPSLLRMLEPAGFSCVVRRGYLDALRAGCVVHSFDHPGYFADAGTPSRFLDAHWHVLMNEPRAKDGRPEDSVDTERQLWLEQGVAMGDGVTLDGPVYLGRGASVGDGASLKDVLIEAGGTVQKGEQLAGAIRLVSGATAFRHTA